MRSTCNMMVVGFTVATLSACADSSRLAGPSASPANSGLNASASILDAAHGGSGGFYFLEPLVAQPSDTARLDTTQSNNLRIDVCPLAADPSVQSCSAPAVTVSATSPVFIDVNGNHYQMNWQTDATSFPANIYYRVSVIDVATGGAWGHVDVYLGSTGQGFHSIDNTNFTPLLDGRTVPIKFRIDIGATPPQSGGGVVSIS